VNYVNVKEGDDEIEVLTLKLLEKRRHIKDEKQHPD
jgi:hypothetical protein